MSSNSISTIGLQLQSIASLLSQQTTLGNLDEQLASGQLYDNLTDYAPTTAKNLMDFQNSVTQNQAYIAGMQTVSSRLSLYNQTMGDMENVAAEGQELAAGNQTLDPTTLSQLQSQAQTYLSEVTDDLNQQIGGRYIYAGTRYTTPPVTNLANLTTEPYDPTTQSFTAATTPTLPYYDSQYSAVTINALPASAANFQVGNTTVNWGDLEAGSVTTVEVNGVSTPVTITGLSAATTPTELASNLQATITQLSSQIGDFSGLSASVNGATVSLQASAVGQNNTVTVDSAPTGNFQAGNTDLSWSQVESGTVTSVTINGVSTAVNLTLPNANATTPAEIAQNLQSAITQLAASTSPSVPDFSGLTASVSGAVVSLYSTPNSASIIPNSGGTSSEITWAIGSAGTSITPDSGGNASDLSWSSGAAGTTAQTFSSSAGAYTEDSVAVDSATSITYGVTSNNPAFQQLIAGLQFINAATQSGVSAATYKTDMAQANTLLTTALSGIQSLNATVASNQNILSTETSSQNSDITNLQNQLSSLQSVDLTTVGTEIDNLQTQLQASYSATAALTQLSLLKYL